MSNKLDIRTIREIIQSVDDGIYLTDIAKMLGVTQQVLLNFIEAKSDQYGEDPFGQPTKVSDMEEAIQIKMFRDEAQKLFFRHISYLGFIERYRGAWGPSWEDTPPDNPSDELMVNQYGSFFTQRK